MKINKPITLWDKIQQAISDLTDDEEQPDRTEAETVDKLIELAHHYRLEYKRLDEERESNAWMS